METIELWTDDEEPERAYIFRDGEYVCSGDRGMIQEIYNETKSGVDLDVALRRHGLV